MRLKNATKMPDSSISLILTTLKYFCMQTMETKKIVQFEIIINVLVMAFSASFQYLCYGCTVIIDSIDIFFISARGLSLDVRIRRL